MSNFIGATVKRLAGNKAATFAQQYEPERALPPGLTSHEAKVLRKVRSRAHYLDKGFRICGLRFGWTFIIGLIPFVGDVTDALLNYNLVVKKAKEIEGIPNSLIQRMMINNSISIGIGFVPIVGDVALAAWKTNWRNAELLENYLRERHATGTAHIGAAGPSGSTTTATPASSSAQMGQGGTATTRPNAQAPNLPPRNY
ncbi:hypothetical protein MPSI1_000888 [Malassezia psittaci]|uniref:Uncharacterized protein n=1 Tax=Malassezia psittaci TaxID=1821823 RepID=A0AAF0FCI2_9BASI|nr:hypothetical protein MPSI1_000888 [Malassezia psittaci]